MEKLTEKLSEERQGRCDNPDQPHLKQLHHMYQSVHAAARYDSGSDLLPLDFNSELMSIVISPRSCNFTHGNGSFLIHLTTKNEKKISTK